MFENDTLQRASEYAKSALLRMEFLGLAPTPHNFELLYAYASGRIPEIKPIIDEAVRKGGLNPEQAKLIREKFLTNKSDAQIIEEGLKSISKELARIMTLMEVASKGTDNYNRTLTNFTGELQKPLPVDELRAVVARVVNETQGVIAVNYDLTKKLDESSLQLTALKEDLSKAQKESLTDTLTNVGNRKHMINEIKRLGFEADEQKTPLSLLMVDIDYFKKFNDTHGHLLGDQVLRLVARTLTENVKGRDVVTRYGGEEFVIILPQTKLSDAQHLADMVRSSVAQKNIVRRDNNQSLGSVTISVGVAQYQAGEPLVRMLHRADAGVYMAKKAGRNRVVAQDLDEAALAKIIPEGSSDRFADLEL